MCQSSPGHFPTELGVISSVLGKQVVVVSCRGLSAVASLGLPRRGCVGGLSLLRNISQGTAAAPCTPWPPSNYHGPGLEASGWWQRSPQALLPPTSGQWTLTSPGLHAQPASSSCGRTFSCGIISQRKCLPLN